MPMAARSEIVALVKALHATLSEPPPRRRFRKVSLDQKRARVFGVLMSLEPAVAALIGFVVLGEMLGGRVIAAILLVTVAAAGASRFR